MKKFSFLIGLLVCQLSISAQVGLGTTSPNPKSILDISSTSKGILLPRVTSLQRDSIDNSLTSSDVGMMVFQTSPTKGLFYWDGSQWNGLPTISPVTNFNGATLRWDGDEWVATTNLFNQGTTIGIGTTNPKSHLHIHTPSAPTSSLRLTTWTTEPLLTDGLVLGVNSATREAYLKHYEKKALWFATDSIERMRIDSAGNIGINKTNPAAKLDVNGSFKLGSGGTVLNGIIQASVMIDVPLMSGNSTWTVDIPVPNAMTTGSVHISPADSMGDIMIAYARVSEPNTVQVKFMNAMTGASDPAQCMFYVSVIQ
jgi:hypothetical protein